MAISSDKIVKFLNKKLAVSVYDELDSTNNEAKRSIKQHTDAPALYVTDRQTAGRGRRGHSFYSPKGTGLYFTLSLPFSGQPQSVQKITCVAAVAVCEAIEALSDQKPMVKWVNDIYISGKKVCGILTELVSDLQNRPCAVIIGVGINLTTERFPDELRMAAGCVGDIDPNRLCAMICNRLMQYYADIDNNSILEKYKQLNVCIGKMIRYTEQDSMHHATAVDIDADGGLIVEENGTRRTLRSGEISIILDQ